MSVIAHIAGPSGAGKTTIGEKLKHLYPQLLVRDLDEIDEIAHAELFDNKPKKYFTDDDIRKLARRRQQLLDLYIKENKNKDIVLVGIHTEGETVLNVYTDNKWMLNTLPFTSAYRAYLRSQHEKPEHRRLLSELPMDYQEAKDVVAQLNELGYRKYSPEQIIRMIGKLS